MFHLYDPKKSLVEENWINLKRKTQKKISQGYFRPKAMAITYGQFWDFELIFLHKGKY